MEITLQNLEKRLRNLRDSLNDDDKIEKLRHSLKEKGVECAIILPIFEVVLDYDPFADIEFERKSDTQNKQTFDILIEGRFLIESKKLGENLDDHESQIRRYVEGNENINYGIITNGVDYQVWMQKSYIYDIFGEDLSDLLPEKKKGVIKLFEFGLQNNSDNSIDSFLSIMTAFHKEKYNYFFEACAKFVGSVSSKTRGKRPILLSKKSEDSFVKNEIKKNCLEERGFFDVRYSGRKVRYVDSGLEICGVILDNGFVEINYEECNINDFQSCIRHFKNVLDVFKKWQEGRGNVYSDPIQIIKELRGLSLIKYQDSIRNRFNIEKL